MQANRSSVIKVIWIAVLLSSVVGALVLNVRWAQEPFKAQAGRTLVNIALVLLCVLAAYFLLTMKPRSKQS